MSFPVVIMKQETVIGSGFTQPIPDIANSTSAIFMIKATGWPKAKDVTLDLFIQVWDAASEEWFDFCKMHTITREGKYTFPQMDDVRFFQTIPGKFRIKYEYTGKESILLSIGCNAVS